MALTSTPSRQASRSLWTNADVWHISYHDSRRRRVVSSSCSSSSGHELNHLWPAQCRPNVPHRVRDPQHRLHPPRPLVLADCAGAASSRQRVKEPSLLHLCVAFSFTPEAPANEPADGEAIAGVAVIRAFGSSQRFMSLMLDRCSTNVTFYWSVPPRSSFQSARLTQLPQVPLERQPMALDPLCTSQCGRRRSHGVRLPLRASQELSLMIFVQVRTPRRREQDRRCSGWLCAHFLPQRRERHPVPCAALQ